MPDEETKDGEAEWVKITTLHDGFSFIVPRKAAQASGTLKDMLSTDSGFVEARSKACTLDMRPVVLEKVLEYLVHKAQYEKAGPKEEIPDFTERIVPELALQMLMAADYLDT